MWKNCTLMHLVMKLNILLLICGLFVPILCKNIKEHLKFQRVCYYGQSDPIPSKLNATLCTHIIAGFSSVRNCSLFLGNYTYKMRYLETTRLKEKYPDLKVMLSVGGGGNDEGFSWAFNSTQNRTRFIASVLYILKKYNFDGLDIDWEFPVWNDNIPEDKDNFIALLQELKIAGEISSKRTLLLSVAVAAPKVIIDVAYNIPLMAKYVDFINLMSYDYHDYMWYTPATGHNSPLFNRSVEKAYFSTLNTAWSALYWYTQGMPKSKIMVGIPTYAHTYKLLNPAYHGLDAPSTGLGIGSGGVSFYDVCVFLLTGGTRVFDNESKVPYAYHDFDWITYEDYTSTSIKAQWVKSQGYGGVMTFDLNSDDWQGVCDGKTLFPLHQIIYNTLTI